MKESVKKGTVLAIIAAVLLYGLYAGLRDRGPYDFAANIEKTAAYIDGEPLTLAEVALYVIYVERTIEEDAALYNPENTRDYWNARINNITIAGEAKRTALGMAVHDKLFYKAAVEKGLTLDEGEETYLENAAQDFWMDLLDEQTDRLPVSDEQIEESLYRMALSQKYQSWLAKENGRLYHEFDWDGYDYEQLFAAAHTLRKNPAVWQRVHLGNITLLHDGVNYINGMTEEEREEKKNTHYDRNEIFFRSYFTKDEEP